jgi:hypothetical protein
VESSRDPSRAPSPISSPMLSVSSSPSRNGISDLKKQYVLPEPEMEESDQEFIATGDNFQLNVLKSVTDSNEGFLDLGSFLPYMTSVSETNPLTTSTPISIAPSSLSMENDFKNRYVVTTPSILSPSPSTFSSSTMMIGSISKLPTLEYFLSTTLNSISSDNLKKHIEAFESAGCNNLEPMMKLDKDQLKEFLVEDVDSGLGKMEVRLIISGIGRLKKGGTGRKVVGRGESEDE